MGLLTIVLAGLATIALAAPGATPSNEDTSITSNGPPFINKPGSNSSYHCSDTTPNVIETRVESGYSTAMIPVYNCLRNDCYEFTTGATCGESTIDIKARTPIPEENKHKTCSKDRASVLICRYGFCSTDHYCNLHGVGDYCHDDCNCCKKGDFKKAGDESKREDLEASISTASSQDSAADIKPRNRCTVPGSYMCDETFQAIGVCNSVYQWVLSADCRPGHCVENLDAGTAFCVAKKSIRDLDTHGVSFAASEYCENPGTYTCSTDGSAVGVCNAQHEWQLSADCSPGHCTMDGPDGTAFCVTKKSDRSLDTRAAATTAQHCDKQGAYQCDSTGQRIAVCSSANEWILSSDCSPGHCVDGPNNTAYCTAKRELHQ
ncbi:hypothetical protein T440DRAFT_455861 [Plenodomus tracheiphilus IPT5]|uniref:Carbohydrate-binding module family 18 protein n=1 Tax=Plenodomus tracheiphilus IPT5 TaxID=1408161 RepID=A0A6A7AWV7_9PLEO|nr:hypothetical protein T440DRAFT_455861 [Plenodomus tracheiphilus IPT5]